mmetsp:Transcript_456/g.1082  ORF Transcript_456/g.1082 Transcript_456/m.1082 type:complete len:97 (+) Transcript_456:583-873(+)
MLKVLNDFRSSEALIKFSSVLDMWLNTSFANWMKAKSTSFTSKLLCCPSDNVHLIWPTVLRDLHEYLEFKKSNKGMPCMSASENNRSAVDLALLKF